MAKDTSGLLSWVRPPGFQDAAVASSATAMKALPMPMARAPDPTGLGDDVIVISCGICAITGLWNRLKPKVVRKTSVKRIRCFGSFIVVTLKTATGCYWLKSETSLNAVYVHKRDFLHKKYTAIFYLATTLLPAFTSSS